MGNRNRAKSPEHRANIAAALRGKPKSTVEEAKTWVEGILNAGEVDAYDVWSEQRIGEQAAKDMDPFDLPRDGNGAGQ